MVVSWPQRQRDPTHVEGTDRSVPVLEVSHSGSSNANPFTECMLSHVEL